MNGRIGCFLHLYCRYRWKSVYGKTQNIPLDRFLWAIWRAVGKIYHRIIIIHSISYRVLEFPFEFCNWATDTTGIIIFSAQCAHKTSSYIPLLNNIQCHYMPTLCRRDTTGRSHRSRHTFHYLNDINNSIFNYATTNEKKINWNQTENSRVIRLNSNDDKLFVFYIYQSHTQKKNNHRTAWSN